MKNIQIGIHVHAEPERLRATLDSVRAHTLGEFDLVLLPDGADLATRQALAALSDIPQSSTPEPRGGAACFNRLIKSSSAEVHIFLESGSIVSPGWLHYLLEALNADPGNGLAGPSTNHSWNEQGIFPHASGKPDMITRTAKEAASRFGSTWRMLEPLYSLADFCYVVRREVIESVGAADEGYGLGPCWEMDYNIRAARAGWRGVWACGAYVYREPFTARRVEAEQRYFESSKHRYQDKFCGLRLNSAKIAYEPHCKGDACEFFAPSSRIQISIPFTPSRALPTNAPPTLLPVPTSTIRVDHSADEALPLVTCIMPTRNRLDYVRQSIRYFERQDYPEKELIIVDDSFTDISKELPNDPRLRVLHAARPMSIGAKRNWACEMAKGQIIAQWDDDDFYSPRRLSAQVAPLLAGTADISGLVTNVIFDLPAWRFWRLSPALHKRMFVGDIHGGTLVYWRKIWQDLARYPDRSLAEDAIFLSKAVRNGAHQVRLENNGNFIYLRHSTNSWEFKCGQFIDPAGWQRISEPNFAAEDRQFYLNHSDSPPDVPKENSLPLVSAIMPTANRRPFVGKAIEYFRRQDYRNKELIIIDDGTDPVGDLVPEDDDIIYLYLPPRLSVGAKRNLACEKARGEIILHWDDDDWHASHRISYQVETLLKTTAEVCGINSLLFYDKAKGQAWQYVYPRNQRFWLSGSTLCYRKAFWGNHRFPEIDVGEDARFVWSGSPNQMIVLPDSSFHVSIIHDHNVSAKQTRGAYWRLCSAEIIQELLKEDWPFYQPQLK